MAGNGRRNRTPPEVAHRYGVSPKKIIDLIHDGELTALNLARRGCTRPRYSITPEALEAFERARTVVPRGAGESTRKLRRQKTSRVKQFF